MNYKNKITGEVICTECYNRLPFSKRMNYIMCYESVTHEVSEDDSGNFLTTLIIAESMFDSSSSQSFESNPSIDTSSDTSFSGFDGGDGGGGGASGDW